MIQQKSDDVLIKEFWERIDGEIKRQNISKMQLAERCRFNRQVMFGYYNLTLPHFALLCKELNASADYLLFDKK